MPLDVRLDDEHRWQVCVPRARLEVRLRWTELEPDAAQLAVIPYRSRSSRLGWPVGKGSGVLTYEEAEDGPAWAGTATVEAGRFFSRRIRFTVDRPSDPPRTASVRLIPKASAALALLLLVSSLVTLASVTAATLSTLHLNFSYSHAVTGLGGLTVLGLAAKVVHSVSDKLRIDGLPLYGMGYLLGRTVFACVAGAALVSLIMPNCVTTVVNETEAKVEFKLPGGTGRLALGPDQEITFLGRVDHVGATVLSSLAEEDRFCVVDERGDGLNCRSQSPVGEHNEEHWSRGLFAPAHLRLACQERRYRATEPELSAAQVVSWFTPFLPRQEERSGVEVELAADCKAKKRAEDTIAREVSEGFRARYVFVEPQTFDSIEGSPPLVVESASGVPRSLRMQAPAQEEDDGTKRPGASLAIDVEAGRRVSDPILTPHGLGAAKFTVVEVATSRRNPGERSGSGVELGAVDCLRTTTDLENHFRLVSVPASDPSSALLELVFTSTAVPGWRSEWRDLRPDFSGGDSPLLCAVASGPGARTSAAITPGALRAKLVVYFPDFETDVELRVPGDYMASRVEVVTQGEEGTKARGILECTLPALKAGASYVLRPVWARSHRGRRVGGLRSLEVGQPSLNGGSEQGAATSCRSYHSRWTTEVDDATGARNGWFPAWVCLPSQWSDADAECVDEEDRAEVRELEVFTGRRHRATVELRTGRATLIKEKATPCFLDRSTGRLTSRCSVDRCKRPLGSDVRDRINEQLGESCSKIYACKSPGERC